MTCLLTKIFGLLKDTRRRLLVRLVGIASPLLHTFDGFVVVTLHLTCFEKVKAVLKLYLI
jgi:hypothetical protein